MRIRAIFRSGSFHRKSLDDALNLRRFVMGIQHIRYPFQVGAQVQSLLGLG